MDPKVRTAANLELVGGRLCLDFANTVSTHGQAGREYLASYQDLLAWSQHAGILDEPQAQDLLRRAERHPQRAAAALQGAIALREAIYRVFAALAHGWGPQAPDLASLNAFLRTAHNKLEIAAMGGGFGWAWVPDEGDLAPMAWPIVHSAADLLTSDALDRVSQCAGQNCDWLFLDTSKNHSRRWCTMAVCGSRAKMRRYYRRKTTKSTAPKGDHP